MKLKIIIIAVLAVASLSSLAQDIEYYYDAAGNRITRKLIPPDPQVSPIEELGEETTAETESKTEVEVKSQPEVYNDLVAEKQFKIYPNPTRGKLKIDMLNYSWDTQGSIQVFDLTGRLVKQIENLNSSMELDITKEPAGSYIMIIIIGNEKSEWKIVKH